MKESWYCAAGVPEGCSKCNHIIDWRSENSVPGCTCRHRKHPTPEQFREEYGREYPDDGAVYWWWKDYRKEALFYDKYSTAKYYKKEGSGGECIVICACTPYGKPDDDFEVTE
ncbi:hypothetical protein FACS1894137_11220 [Spirochaetia bacterium]|nr:hypothetical protein FACS1894137_11220 [Spirochaetia bacterium]